MSGEETGKFENIFVTDDKWLLEPWGVIDPDDKAILDQFEKSGKVVRMRLEDTLKIIKYKGAENIKVNESPDIDDGLIKLSPEMVNQFRAQGSKLFSSYELFFKAVMRQQVAEKIRSFRIDERRSWRSVARKSFEYWPEWFRWDPPSNQVAGMALCKIAAEYLGEDYFTDPWN